MWATYDYSRRCFGLPGFPGTSWTSVLDISQSPERSFNQHHLNAAKLRGLWALFVVVPDQPQDVDMFPAGLFLEKWSVPRPPKYPT